jgi:hypothetical protein
LIALTNDEADDDGEDSDDDTSVRILPDPDHPFSSEADH